MPRFDSIMTHLPNLKMLQSSADLGTLPHAMLLWGPEGSGALAATVAIAQYLMCTDRGQAGPCGQCRGCAKAGKHMHPDIHYAFPTIGSKVTGDQLYGQWRTALSENVYMNRNQWLERIDAEGKQGNINVADCMRMTNLLMMQRIEGECKVLIIWLPEYLGKEGNRLLKLIEEPPKDSFIFLVAESRDEILPTILSRCQQFYFPLIAEEKIREGLVTHLNLEEGRAAGVAAAAQGDWNVAIQIAQGTVTSPIQWTQEWIKAAYQRSPASIAEWTEVASKYSREENKRILGYLLALLEKVLWLKYGKDFLATDEEKKIITFLNTKIEYSELLKLVELCEENLRAVQQNASGRMLWFHATMQLQKILLTENAVLHE